MHARTIAPLAAAALTAARRARRTCPGCGPRPTGRPGGGHDRDQHRPRRRRDARSTPAATQVGLRVLKKGGNAVDAAIATAAALGVTEPYSSGIGGGGYFVFYNAEKGKVQTIDGRETAPAGITPDAFIDPATGKAYNFTPELVTSGVSVGVPGTPATWDKALRRWGTWSLDQTLKPAIKLADRGFIVDPTFRLQTAENQKRFEAFPSTSAIYLPGGQPPAVGSVLKNPDLADTYRLLADKGVKKFYRGKLAGEIAGPCSKPPKSTTTTLPVPPGSMTTADLHDYRVVNRKPTSVGYRGYDVYGMAPSSSGGIDRRRGAQHHGALRPRGHDRHRRPAPLPRGLGAGLRRPRRLRRRPALRRRAAGRSPRRHLRRRAGLQDQRDHGARQAGRGRATPRRTTGAARRRPPATARDDADTENISTTNMTVTDRWGNVVEYTLTIEQTGGSGIVVPGRGLHPQQRADRLLDGLQRERPQPDPARQAPALLDVADDRAQGRRAVPGARLARAARRSSPRCCRCCSTASTAG